MAVALKSEQSPLSVDFCGLSLDSPIVLLSGCVGFGEEYTRIEGFSNRDVGAVVLKGTTREPRLGNNPHRVYETPMRNVARVRWYLGFIKNYAEHWHRILHQLATELWL